MPQSPVGIQTPSSVTTLFTTMPMSGYPQGASATQNGGALTQLFAPTMMPPLNQPIATFQGTFVLFRDEMPNARWQVASLADINTRLPINFGTPNPVNRVTISTVSTTSGIPALIEELAQTSPYQEKLRYVPAVAESMQNADINLPAGYVQSSVDSQISGNDVMLKLFPTANAPTGAQPQVGYWFCQ